MENDQLYSIKEKFFIELIKDEKSYDYTYEIIYTNIVNIFDKVFGGSVNNNYYIVLYLFRKHISLNKESSLYGEKILAISTLGYK